MGIDVTVSLGDLGNITELAERGAKLALGAGLEIMANAARATAPVSSGVLAKSVRATDPSGSLRSGDLGGAVVAAAPHAAPIEFGSGLHGPKAAKYPILPKNKKALRFAVGGSVAAGSAGTTIRRKVMHPGVEGQHFIEKAVNEQLPATAAAIEKNIALAIGGKS